MKSSWFIKEFLSVLIVLASSFAFLIWAVFEAKRASHSCLVLGLGLAGGLVPILIELFIAYRSKTLFIRDKKSVAARKTKNQQLARMLLMPAFAFGLLFMYFSDSIKIILLGMAAGYLVPFSLLLMLHFLKHHKEIEGIFKNNR